MQVRVASEPKKCSSIISWLWTHQWIPNTFKTRIGDFQGSTRNPCWCSTGLVWSLTRPPHLPTPCTYVGTVGCRCARVTGPSRPVPSLLKFFLTEPLWQNHPSRLHDLHHHCLKLQVRCPFLGDAHRQGDGSPRPCQYPSPTLTAAPITVHGGFSEAPCLPLEGDPSPWRQCLHLTVSVTTGYGLVVQN